MRRGGDGGGGGDLAWPDPPPLDEASSVSWETFPFLCIRVFWCPGWKAHLCCLCGGVYVQGRKDTSVYLGSRKLLSNPSQHMCMPTFDHLNIHLFLYRKQSIPTQLHTGLFLQKSLKIYTWCFTWFIWLQSIMVNFKTHLEWPLRLVLKPLPQQRVMSGKMHTTRAAAPLGVSPACFAIISFSGSADL